VVWAWYYSANNSNTRSQCQAWYYGSSTTNSTATCNGACSAWYYCLAWSTSSTQNACSVWTTSPAGSASISSCVDNQAPTITNVTSSSPSCNTIRFTVNWASDNVNLASSPYSFDGWSNWQTASYKDYTNTSYTIITANNIKVKDVAWNIYIYTSSVSWTSSVCVSCTWQYVDTYTNCWDAGTNYIQCNQSNNYKIWVYNWSTSNIDWNTSLISYEWSCVWWWQIMTRHKCLCSQITSTICTNAWWYRVDATTDTIWDGFCISPRFGDWNSDSSLWNGGISWNGWWNTSSDYYNWWDASSTSIRDTWNSSSYTYWQTRTLDSEVSYNCRALWTATSDYITSDSLEWRMKWLATTWNDYTQARSIDWITWLVPHTVWTYPHAIPALYITDCIDWVKDIGTPMGWVTYNDYKTDVTVSTETADLTNVIYQNRQAYLLAWTKQSWSHLPSAFSTLWWSDAWTWPWEYEIACNAGKFWTYTAINQSSQNDQESQERIWLSAVGTTTGSRWGRNARLVGNSGCSYAQSHDYAGKRNTNISARFVVR
jgi:hypothetical protein